MKAAELLHTVRYLRPIQVYDRIRRRLPMARPDTGPAPARRERSGTWIEPIAHAPTMLGPARFRFLNLEHDASFPACWNDGDLQTLWIYNLHYFDDLSAADANARRAWHTALVARWISENPIGHGRGWEPYPLSRRVVNWIKGDLGGGELSPDAVASLAVQVRYLSRRLEYHLLANHLLANAKALIYAGVFFQGDEADRWREIGFSILDAELSEQILADGGHIERSPMYHSIVLEDLLDLVGILKHFPGIDQRCDRFLFRAGAIIQSMRLWLAAMCHPDGEIALFNDAAMGIAATPEALQQYAARLQFDAVGTVADGITLLESSGYVRMQSGPSVVIADVAALGPDYNPGHAHADTLSFEWSLRSQRVLVNCGTSIYEAGDLRSYQRSTAAHNTVVVDEEDSSQMWGAFRVARRARPFDLAVDSQGEQLRVACSHDGYRRLPGRVDHRREWTLDPQTFSVEDTLTGTPRSAEARYHWHPDFSPADTDPSDETQATFRAGDAAVSWRGSTSGHTYPSSYYPRFGMGVPNHCLVTEVEQNQAVSRFTWNDTCES